MIKIATYKVREASRLYGETMEKQALDVSIDPTAVAAGAIGSVVGSYIGDVQQYKMEQKKALEDRLRLQRVQTIENNYYAQIENLLAHLKIVFTPINVLYSVNNQVFEIIRTEEMSPMMKNAFLRKDHDFFRNLLMNKINMELQLAERVFTQKMLQQPGFSPSNAFPKQASIIDFQARINQMSIEELEKWADYWTAEFDQQHDKIAFPLNFDHLRPFEQSDCLVHPQGIQKVAGLFDYFTRAQPQDNDASVNELLSKVQVGFMPDRVAFVYQGQLVDQMPLFHMNEQGYHAFTRKDSDFFLRLFRQHVVDKDREVQASIPKQATTAEETPEETEEVIEQTAAETTEALVEAVKDAVEDGNFSIPLRGSYEIFVDADIHPLTYAQVFQEKYGENWHEYEIEALMKQVEEDFELKQGISDIPFNKICALFSVMSGSHTVFDTGFAFEKWMRAMNSLPVDVFAFEGNLSLSDFAFGFEMIRTLLGSEQFLALPTEVEQYVAKQLLTLEIRSITADLYIEQDEAERDFFENVNEQLKELWLAQDGFASEDPMEREMLSRLHEHIVQTVNIILAKFADELDVQNWYESLETLLVNKRLLDLIPTRYREAVKRSIILNVAFHLEAAITLQTKRYELEDTLHALNKGV